eukprot:13737-Heterococcus_DN1.PRE.2
MGPAKRNRSSAEDEYSSDGEHSEHKEARFYGEGPKGVSKTLTRASLEASSVLTHDRYTAPTLKNEIEKRFSTAAKV